VHLLVSELYIYKNVRCNNKKYVIVTQCTAFNLTFTQLDLSKANLSKESVH